MNRVATYRIPATADAVRIAAAESTLPASLVEPVQALVSAVLRRAAEAPFSIYLCADDASLRARDDLALLLGRAVATHVPSALIVDCDFLRPGLHGLIPQKDALGFLDFLLYGSSIGVISQETAGGVRVVGAGSFPVTRRMPFVETAFADASHRLVAHARCVIYVGPLADEKGEPHPLCRETGVTAVVRVDASSGTDALEERVAEGGVDVWTVRLGGAAEPAPARVEAARPARVAGAPAGTAAASVSSPATVPVAPASREPRYTALVPRLAILAFGVVVIAFVAWWFMQDRASTPGEVGSSGSPATQARPVEPPGPAAPADTTGTASRDTVAAATTAVSADTIREPVDQPAGPLNHADTGGRTGGTLLISPADIHVMAELEQSWRDWYVIHISSFQESIRAREEVAFLESREFPVFIVFLDLGPKGRWYRVYAGPFRTREEAREVKKNLDAVPQVRFTRIAKIPE